MFQFQLTSEEINYKVSMEMLKKMNPKPMMGTIDDIVIYSSALVPEDMAFFINDRGLVIHR